MKKSYLILLSIIFILMLSKVYVANKLYFTSRNIQKNSIQINALKEESNILKLKIEKLKYKNTIIDPLFNYKLESDIINEKTTQNYIKEEDIETKEKEIETENIKKITPPKDAKELFETLDLN